VRANPISRREQKIDLNTAKFEEAETAPPFFDRNAFGFTS
jgi:hypothetical protein